MCSNCNLQINPETADAFAERMIGLVNHAGLGLMISIGHRTGLFDTLAGRAPSTCAQVADAAGLNERYVREWLGAMTTGGIVEHAGDDGTYWLPAERAAFLTTAAGADNIASVLQWISVLGSVEDRIRFTTARHFSQLSDAESEERVDPIRSDFGGRFECKSSLVETRVGQFEFRSAADEVIRHQKVDVEDPRTPSLLP